METPHRWACCISELVWTKLALLNTWVWYDCSAETTVIAHPGLMAAEMTRQKAAKLQASRYGVALPVSAEKIKHQWRIPPHQWKSMTADDWEKLVSEIADAVARYQYSFPP